MASARTLLALGCLLALAVGGHAQDFQASGAKFGPSIYQCITTLGLKKTKAVIDASGLKDYFSTNYQLNTFFAPTDSAWTAFFELLQLSEKEALADKALMKRVVQYTTLPYVRSTRYWPLNQNGFKKQKTLIPGMMLRLWSNTAGRWVVQGFANTAMLLGKPNTYDLVCAKSIVHVTNGVLIPIAVTP